MSKWYCGRVPDSPYTYNARTTDLVQESLRDMVMVGIRGGVAWPPYDGSGYEDTNDLTGSGANATGGGAPPPPANGRTAGLLSWLQSVYEPGGAMGPQHGTYFDPAGGQDAPVNGTCRGGPGSTCAVRFDATGPKRVVAYSTCCAGRGQAHGVQRLLLWTADGGLLSVGGE